MTKIKCAFMCSAYRNTQSESLVKCINSCFTQNSGRTIIEVHVLLYVDGQVSKTLETIIEELEHQYGMYLKVHRSDDNQGLAVGLNFLIDNYYLDYDYLLRIDTDDINLPNRVFMQISYLQDNLDIDVLGGAIIETHHVNPNFSTKRFLKYPTRERILTTIAKRSPVAHPSVCFRSKIFSNPYYRYPISNFNEDIALWFLLIKGGVKFDNLQVPVIEFTIDRVFFNRRSFNKAVLEFKIYSAGIISLGLPVHKLIYPVLRFIFRLMPQRLVAFIYRSKLRTTNK
jgi:hypothetical protein